MHEPRGTLGASPPPQARYRIYTSHDSESRTQEKPLILGHFPHSATRKGQFGVSRCFDSSLAICVDTVAQARGREPIGTGQPRDRPDLRLPFDDPASPRSRGDAICFGRSTAMSDLARVEIERDVDDAAARRAAE